MCECRSARSAEAPSPQRGFPALFPAARVPPLPRRLSRAFPPFAAPLTSRTASAPLLPALASRPVQQQKARSFILSAKGRIPRVQRKGFSRCSSSGSSEGGRARSIPSQIHTDTAARKATRNVMLRLVQRDVSEMSLRACRFKK